jgi:electron transport complex protein RnfG
MSIWATCSELRVGVALGGLLLFTPPAPVRAQISLAEALRAAFPEPAAIERRTAFLSREDLMAARGQAGRDVPVTQSVVTYYVAREDGRPVGVAYLDSHRVRTLNEVIMLVLDPAGRVRNVEVLRFEEPPEYHASEPWLEQFRGKSLTPELSLEGSIANMTGATLTSNAIVRATRRLLALHARIRPFEYASGSQP